MRERDTMRDHKSRPKRTPAEGVSAGSQHLKEQAYRSLREALIRGDFAPGERSLRRIAAAFGISAMPVRTCLRRLAAEQCLDIGPGGTAVVPRLRRADFAEIIALRSVLKPMAAGLAATASAPTNSRRRPVFCAPAANGAGRATRAAISSRTIISSSRSIGRRDHRCCCR